MLLSSRNYSLLLLDNEALDVLVGDAINRFVNLQQRDHY